MRRKLTVHWSTMTILKGPGQKGLEDSTLGGKDPAPTPAPHLREVPLSNYGVNYIRIYSH